MCWPIFGILLTYCDSYSSILSKVLAEGCQLLRVRHNSSHLSVLLFCSVTYNAVIKQFLFLTTRDNNEITLNIHIMYVGILPLVPFIVTKNTYMPTCNATYTFLVAVQELCISLKSRHNSKQTESKKVMKKSRVPCNYWWIIYIGTRPREKCFSLIVNSP